MARLADVLSKPCSTEFVQVDGIVTKTLGVGNQRKLDIGRVGVNYYCTACNDTRTFWSDGELYCIGVSPRQISIDCVLKCGCGATVAVWFLVESFEDSIVGLAPTVRILKRRERLSEQVRLDGGQYVDYIEMLDKAVRAYRDGLGAGAMVYLRKIFEQLTAQTAIATGIAVTNGNGKRKPFKQLLTEVDAQRHIIPAEFAADGYRLFGELSDVVHGDNDEDLALQKFEPLHRLVVGILDNIKNNRELTVAIGTLGWNKQTGGTV
jgi:hypothetical protein